MSTTLNLLSDSTFGDKLDEQNAILEDIRDNISGGGGSFPYIAMTVDEYLAITPQANKAYWVYNAGYEHGVYLNGNCVEGKDVAVTNPWVAIQNLVRAGTFANTYSVGDQFTVKFNNVDTAWDIVAIDVATPADSNLSHSVTLMPHDCLDALMFDNAEPNNPNSDRKSYGNNRYKESNIRLYLNSSGAAGTWWSSQGTYDAAPDYATTKAGFMSNFESDFLEVIGKTKIRVAKNTVTDGGSYEDLSDEYFYLASETEVGLGNENNIAEGSTFPYFSDNNRRIKNYQGSAKWWWLRTPDASYSRYVRSVDTGGSLDGYDAYGATGLAAACNII